MSLVVEKDIFIPARIPSLNTWKGRHWRSYARLKNHWLNLLRLFAPHGDHRDTHRRMSITAHQKSRRGFYDLDNFIGGCKPVLDAVKGTGWIKDDHPKWITCDYDQKVVGENKITEVGTQIVFYEQHGAGPVTLPTHICCERCLIERMKLGGKKDVVHFKTNPVGECSCGEPGFVELL